VYENIKQMKSHKMVRTELSDTIELKLSA